MTDEELAKALYDWFEGNENYAEFDDDVQIISQWDDILLEGNWDFIALAKFIKEKAEEPAWLAGHGKMDWK